MKLLQSLTGHLKNNGAPNLESWAEDGVLGFSSQSEVQGLTLQYTANFEMTDITKDPITLSFLVATWISKNNPERDNQGLQPPEFFSERLQNSNYDLGFRIKFQEDYLFTLDPQGDWNIDGKTYSITSQSGERIEFEDMEYLEVVDSHTQDNEMTSHA